MNKTIVGLGEILWDIFPERKVLGGAPANFAYHISQFGLDGYAVSAIGKDDLGADLIKNLESKGLGYLIEETDFPTGTVDVKVNRWGIPEYKIHQNVAWDNIPFIEKTRELAAKTSAVSFGSLAQRSSVSRDTIRQFLQAMPQDSLKIFDINLRQQFYSKEVIHESLEMANVLKINDEEVVVLAEMYGWKGWNEQDVCKDILAQYKLDIVILTKGIDGSFVFTRKETSYQATPKMHVADTVGAGDSFTAAFVASYLHGDRITEAHQLAVEVSAYVCTQHGAMPVLPDAYRELFNQ
ncbi:carbohydrate kinase family protein [Dysgonomonas macrotermitis]|uniref:Fructokinase n=1 Tax=Dysgonomonas macrotermitis TaxID=1346286 RepID=A0A1M5H2V9_9BACT|nr:carbohydrate kinase [Dysgonomonas macrotermitis]SHG10284.1 fructokinase [Dysgonomonas macrotermitis]